MGNKIEVTMRDERKYTFVDAIFQADHDTGMLLIRRTQKGGEGEEDQVRKLFAAPAGEWTSVQVIEEE